MKIRRKMFHILNNQKGISLVELLISIVILALVAGAYLGSYVHVTRTNIAMGQVTDGTSVSQQWMEELYSISKESTVTDIEGIKNHLISEGFSSSVSGNNHIFMQPIGGYYVRIVINTGYYSHSNMYKVVVVAYKDSGYTEVSAKMQGIITLG